MKDYVEASSPDFTVGEYWDSLSYQLDGTPAHDQDMHRQRIINWINAAGGLATAFGERAGLLAGLLRQHGGCMNAAAAAG